MLNIYISTKKGNIQIHSNKLVKRKPNYLQIKLLVLRHRGLNKLLVIIL